MNKILVILPLATALGACSHKSAPQMADEVVVETTSVAVGYPASENVSTNTAGPKIKMLNPEGIMMKATAFKMSGDYVNNVAVSLDAAGNLTYYPAPSDINANSMPISLGDGWYLNRQGLGPASVFTSYTFKEYAALPQTPSRQQIKDAIIPGAMVTEFTELPCTLSQAQADPAAVKAFLGISE